MRTGPDRRTDPLSPYPPAGPIGESPVGTAAVTIPSMITEWSIRHSVRRCSSQEDQGIEPHGNTDRDHQRQETEVEGNGADLHRRQELAQELQRWIGEGVDHL